MIYLPLYTNPLSFLSFRFPPPSEGHNNKWETGNCWFHSKNNLGPNIKSEGRNLKKKKKWKRKVRWKVQKKKERREKKRVT
jgi:hypothetical protein